MPDKTFLVKNPKARNSIAIAGKNLADALKKAGLNPSIYQQILPIPESEDTPNGDNQGDAREEDN